MSQARSSLPRTLAAHAVLILYTLIALFPVFVIVINSFKNRRAIFTAPLALPAARDLRPRSATPPCSRQGDFLLYFQNSLIVTVASLFCVLLFGAMAAFALSEYRFRGNTLMGLYLALGIMIPIRLGTVAILQLMVASGLVNTLTALDPRLHRPGPAARRLHPLGVHEVGLRRPEERRPHRRPQRVHASSSASSCRWSARRWRRSRSSP